MCTSYLIPSGLRHVSSSATDWARRSWTDLGNLSEASATLAVFLCIVLAARILQWYKFVRSLPPGPWGLPFIGYLPFLKGHVHLQYRELAKQYGSIFSARLGTQLVVVLSDYNIIRKAFGSEEFTARPHTEFTNILEGYGVINTDGNMWKDQRKFLFKKLQNFGMTAKRCIEKKGMERSIMVEVNAFIRGLSLTCGPPTNISPSLGRSVSNVICSIIMGVRFKVGDATFKRFMDLIEEGFRLFGSMVAVNFIPIMRYLPCLMKVRNKIVANRDEMANFFQDNVEYHRSTFNPEKIRDLVDSYLVEIREANKEGRGHELFQGKNHDRQMQQIMADLYSAGMETVKTTLEWAIVLMLHYPEAAQAVREELDRVVGRRRLPCLDDLPNLPITEATILEVLRRSSIVPLGTTHATTKDVKVNGYMIPSGTQVVPLLHAVHMDPKLWYQPEEFLPTRFLSPEGKVQKPKYFMPFGIGRRMCLGEPLARMEIFLFFSSLLHKFDLKLPSGAPLPSLLGNAGVTVTPDPFQVCLAERELEVKEEIVRNHGSH